MQSWKFNSIARSILFHAIARSLDISFTDVYKIIREMNGNMIKTKDGKIYEVILREW